jgi:3-methyl-2-oxobutanoate hydroxymethyltransferase
VLELLPQELTARISKELRAPTIGIGSGVEADAQVLVVNDLAGITRREFKHNRRYGVLGEALRNAVAAYAADVRAGRFPGEEHAFHMPDEERAAFERALSGQ